MWLLTLLFIGGLLYTAVQFIRNCKKKKLPPSYSIIEYVPVLFRELNMNIPN